MKISIITVCRNSAATIEDSMHSVLSQTHNDLEYIVIDGASTDGTIEIIEKYRKKLSVFVTEKDQGIYDAINKGLQMASGEVVGILNSDDFYADENVLSKIASKFENEKCEAVYADLVYVDRQKTSSIIRTWKAGIYSDGLFFKGWMPPHPTFFVRKSVYDRYGIFNSSFRLAADYEIMLRFIHKHKIKTAYLPEIIVNMRSGGAGDRNLKAKWIANREDHKAWEVNGIKPGVFTLIRKPLSKIFQFFFHSN